MPEDWFALLDASTALDAAIAAVTGSLGAAASSVNPSAKAPNTRWKLAGSERLLLTATPGADGRSSVGLTHSGIAEESGLGAAKTAVRKLLADIQTAIDARSTQPILEGGDPSGAPALGWLHDLRGQSCNGARESAREDQCLSEGRLSA
jgi:hypothetical protein